ncbi:terminase small subunit [Rhizobium rhizogenes]|uniref:terminase small subunit n=1 Tax=Rhizobium rhizogenes TaxID=359 RepID=UPI00157219CB|nr:terminase small subunit [Rhizobium rhizogenes]NTI35567.1 terminase small subunit [Rhizobium rhizogenes]WEO63542.1 terminase small subunit [Rhizobium rhizogenes]
MPLTRRQQNFVREYLRQESAYQAAIESGYAVSSAGTMASRMMADPEIIAAIEEGQRERIDRIDMDADILLKRLVAELNADLADIYDDNGDLLPIHEWPLIWRQGLVAGVETEVVNSDEGEISHVRKVRLSDRVRRIEAIGRHISVQAFKENVRIEGLDTLADRLLRAGERADGNGVVRRFDGATRTINAEQASLPTAPAIPAPPPPKDAAPQSASEREVASRAEAAEIIGASPATSYRPVLTWPDMDDLKVETDYDPSYGSYKF